MIWNLTQLINLTILYTVQFSGKIYYCDEDLHTLIYYCDEDMFLMKNRINTKFQINTCYTLYRTYLFSFLSSRKLHKIWHADTQPELENSPRFTFGIELGGFRLYIRSQTFHENGNLLSCNGNIFSCKGNVI